MIRVGAYERISDDTEDTGLGVARQTRDNETQARLRDWEIVEHYTDNDLSAFKRSVVRPRFEQMLQDLAAGRIGGIVGYNLDRLFRQPRDLERAIDIYDDNPTYVFATVEGDINLQTSDGRTMARVMVAFANKSSADTGRRTARKHLELAEAGIPVGGRRPFGWQEDKRTLLADEAELVRTAVADLLAGKALSRIAREWNEAGVMTTAGNPWSPQTLRNYLRSPRLIALRTHRRQVLLDSEGHPVAGKWEPLLDEDTFDRLQMVVGRQGVAATGRRGSRKYLLTGLLRCAVCRGQMHGTNARENGRFNYVCNNNTATDAARHTVSISGHPTDRIIGALVVERLAQEQLEAQPEAEWSGEARLTEVSEQIDSLMKAFLEGRLSEGVVFPRVEALEKEQLEMRQARTAWLLETTGPGLQQVSPDEWAAKDGDAKRATIDRVLSSVYVRQAPSRRAGYDVARLVPVWRGDPQSPPAAAS